MSESRAVAGNGSSTGGGHRPDEIVIDFLLALAHNDLDAALVLSCWSAAAPSPPARKPEPVSERGSPAPL